MTTPDKTDERLNREMEHALDALAHEERSSVSPALEDRIFAASRAALRRSDSNSKRGRFSVWLRPALALAAAVALVSAAAITATLVMRSPTPVATQALSLEDELEVWFESSRSAAATVELTSLRTELDALERSLDHPWPVGGVILEEDMM